MAKTQNIHSTAIIEEGAEIADDVYIGPYSLVGPHVKIGKGTVIHDHVTMSGKLTIGENNEFFSFASIGAPPQDLKYKGENTAVEIGEGNIFREFVSIHRGTMKDRELTTIGNQNFMMAYVHVGHDVVVGDQCVIANSTNFAGHVKVGSRVIIGGGTNISQFVSIGEGAYIGGATAIDRDIPIFCTAYGNRVKLKGINIIGMRRQGHAKQIITEVVDFYRIMEASALSPRSFIEHDEQTVEYRHNKIVQQMIEDIRKSEVGIAPFI
mgnify:CR=1 FL=1